MTSISLPLPSSGGVAGRDRQRFELPADEYDIDSSSLPGTSAWDPTDDVDGVSSPPDRKLLIQERLRMAAVVVGIFLFMYGATHLGAGDSLNCVPAVRS